MAKYINPHVLDNGLACIGTAADAGTVKYHLLKAYAAGDSFATATGNSVAAVAITSGDLTLAAHNTTGRKVTVAQKSATATGNSGATPDLHLAIIDHSNSRVLLVTNETTDRQVLTNDAVVLPSTYWYLTGAS